MQKKNTKKNQIENKKTTKGNRLKQELQENLLQLPPPWEIWAHWLTSDSKSIVIHIK
jgi:hypothetical protein